MTEYTDEGGNVFTTEYDSMGNITAVYDADGNACTRTEYDKAGNVTKTTKLRFNIGGYLQDRNSTTQSVSEIFNRAFRHVPFSFPVQYSTAEALPSKFLAQTIL